MMSLMARQLLPPEVKHALIEVCGRSFWYKQPLFDMLARAGIPEELILSTSMSRSSRSGVSSLPISKRREKKGTFSNGGC